MSDVSDADSDDIADLLGDVDQLDEDLFGIGSKKSSTTTTPPRKTSTGKKVTFAGEDTKPALTKQDRVASEVSLSGTGDAQIMQETGKTAAARSALDDLLGFGSTPKRKSGVAEELKIPKTDVKQSPSSSNLDDLFGPAPRRGGGASRDTPPKKKATDWLGIGGGDSDEEGGSAFQDLLSKKKKDTPPPRQQTEPRAAPPAEKPAQPKSSGFSLPFLEDDFESTKPVQKKAEPVAAAAPAPAQAYVPQPVPVQAEMVMSNQNAIARLTEENGKLEKTLDEQRKAHWDEKQALVQEMKEKVSATEKEAEQDTLQLKKLHKEAMDRLREEHDEELDKMKAKMNQEVEAAASAYEHTKNYRDVVSKVDTALEQLTQISGKVVHIHDEDTETRETKLREREEHVKRLQDRLDGELSDLNFEKEKVHKLLERLELTVADQEKTLERDKWQFEDKKNKFDIEKAAFDDMKQSLIGKVEIERADLQTQKQAFLVEQETLLRKILAEQERLQQERLTFQIQKDSDLAKIKEEALILQQRISITEAVKDDSERTTQEYGMKQKRLLEMEQRLKDEEMDLKDRKNKIEREEEISRIKMQEIAMREAEIGAMTKESSRRIYSEEARFEAQKVDLERRNFLLKEKTNDIVEKQRDLLSQQEKLFMAKEDIERLKTDIQDKKCPTCALREKDMLGQVNTGNNNYLSAQAEKPFDSPSLHRKGSIRSTLRNHTKELERFLKTERSFLQNLP